MSVALAASTQAREETPVATPGVEQTILLDAPLAQFPGKRIRLFTGEFEPGASTPFHLHPGTEILYVLDGEGVMVLPGQAARKLRLGKAVLVEPEPGADSFTHKATNLSARAGMTTLVFVIYDEGGSPAVPLDEKLD